MAKMEHVEDMVIAVGEYQDTRTGETKYRHMTIGKIFMRENGSKVAKMTSMPTGSEASYWNGFINFFEKRDPQQQQYQQQPQQPQTQYQQQPQQQYQQQPQQPQTQYQQQPQTQQQQQYPQNSQPQPYQPQQASAYQNAKDGQ